MLKRRLWPAYPTVALRVCAAGVAFASAIIAFVVSAQLVIAQISIIPDDIELLALGALLMGMIAVVSGIDSLTKSGMSAALKARNGT